MYFIYAQNWQTAASALAERLSTELQTGRATWLLSGGSNLAPAVAAMAAIPAGLTERLTIMLIDERYGLPGHKDSNYQQLLDAGFNHQQATLLPVLQEGMTLDETAQRYDQLLARRLDGSSCVVGQLGIGADGHIAGILPQSPAIHADGLVTAYSAGPYQRITVTFQALRRLSAAYVLVFGDSKQPALHKLQAEDLALDTQPAQILKQLPEAYIYNDQLKEEV